MAKIKFADYRLSAASLERIDDINEIGQEYLDIGQKITLRQLYYQLVSRDYIPNKQTEYSKLSTLTTKGRMAGLIDWDLIEDRLRKPETPYFVKDIADALEDTLYQYRLNLQVNQPYKVIVIVEKDALSGVLERVTKKYMIPLLVNRGYGSCTVMKMLYDIFRKDGRPAIILYIGDHDPSGLDMIRDVFSRVSEFQSRGSISLEIRHIALTKLQIKQYAPPPNPAKLKDPRADKYIAEHGSVSYEVDALRPPVLTQILDDAIRDLLDMDLFNEMLREEERQKYVLSELIEQINSSSDEDESSDFNEDEEDEY